MGREFPLHVVLWHALFFGGIYSLFTIFTASPRESVNIDGLGSYAVIPLCNNRLDYILDNSKYICNKHGFSFTITSPEVFITRKSHCLSSLNLHSHWHELIKSLSTRSLETIIASKRNPVQSNSLTMSYISFEDNPTWNRTCTTKPDLPCWGSNASPPDHPNHSTRGR